MRNRIGKGAANAIRAGFEAARGDVVVTTMADLSDPPERILDRWWREAAIDGVRAKDLEPYFARVEKRIHVAYQDPESIGEDNHLLKRGADAMGWKVIPNLRNQVHCPGSNNCAFGCPTGAKQSALVSSGTPANGVAIRRAPAANNSSASSATPRISLCASNSASW